MSVNDITTLVLAFMGLSILFYAAIRMRKDNLKENLK
jgi:hypothetical protein